MGRSIGEDERAAAELLRGRGWGVEAPMQFRSDMEEGFFALWRRVEPFTMTSLERGYALYRSVLHLLNRKLPGSFIECGVWKGGSALLMALTILAEGATPRDIYLFDTFRGMPEPGEEDKIAWSGESVKGRWKRQDFADWAVGRKEVAERILSTGYPPHRLHLVEGDVEETLLPFSRETGPVALLRLDTDWYASTRVELEVLYPRLQRGGVLIIDDYGHFTGARKAVDDYFGEREDVPLLSRVDYTGRVGVKP